MLIKNVDAKLIETRIWTKKIDGEKNGNEVETMEEDAAGGARAAVAAPQVGASAIAGTRA